ncbi:MAG: FAD-dependent monooxygenase [Solirubrobacterales bacterium]|nr:FAD-dependent monooxygenase [Solirubrobacterales bacterium]
MGAAGPLEPLLLEFLRSLPNAEVRFGCEVVDLNQRGDLVWAVVRSANDPSSTEELQAEFAVGADGAHSVVRRALGIPMQGTRRPGGVPPGGVSGTAPGPPLRSVCHLQSGGRRRGRPTGAKQPLGSVAWSGAGPWACTTSSARGSPTAPAAMPPTRCLVTSTGAPVTVGRAMASLDPGSPRQGLDRVGRTAGQAMASREGPRFICAGRRPPAPGRHGRGARHRPERCLAIASRRQGGRPLGMLYLGAPPGRACGTGCRRPGDGRKPSPMTLSDPFVTRRDETARFGGPMRTPPFAPQRQLARLNERPETRGTRARLSPGGSDDALAGILLVANEGGARLPRNRGKPGLPPARRRARRAWRSRPRVT